MLDGEKIARIRSSKGLKQTDLAEKLGTGQTYISKIEQNMTSINGLNKIKTILAFLNCELRDVLKNEWDEFLYPEAQGGDLLSIIHDKVISLEEILTRRSGNNRTNKELRELVDQLKDADDRMIYQIKGFVSALKTESEPRQNSRQIS